MATTINCDDTGWGFKLISQLQKQEEIDLINSSFDAEASIIKESAALFSMTVEYDSSSKVLRFRKPLKQSND